MMICVLARLLVWRAVWPHLINVLFFFFFSFAYSIGSFCVLGVWRLVVLAGLALLSPPTRLLHSVVRLPSSSHF